MHTQLSLLISREWKCGVTECTCPELKCARSQNTATAINWHQKQQDPDSTAAAPHRVYLTVLPASMSDMVSLLTWMQIYSLPHASPAFHLAVGVAVLPWQPLPPQRQTRDVINVFTWLCLAHA